MEIDDKLYVLLVKTGKQTERVRALQNLYFSTRDKSILTMSMNEERTLDGFINQIKDYTNEEKRRN